MYHTMLLKNGIETILYKMLTPDSSWLGHFVMVVLHCFKPYYIEGQGTLAMYDVST